MKRLFTTGVLALALLAAALARADGAAAKARAEAMISTFQKLGPDAAANRKVYEQLDAFFDYDRLASAPLTGIESKFTPAQKVEFNRKFRELIRGLSFGDSGAFFRRAK